MHSETFRFLLQCLIDRPLLPNLNGLDIYGGGGFKNVKGGWGNSLFNILLQQKIYGH